MAKEKFRLYVWEDCLCDCYCGIMLALARSVEEARELLSEKMSFRDDDLDKAPTIYELDSPVAFYTFGGS